MFFNMLEMSNEKFCLLILSSQTLIFLYAQDQKDQHRFKTYGHASSLCRD